MMQQQRPIQSLPGGGGRGGEGTMPRETEDGSRDVEMRETRHVVKAGRGEDEARRGQEPTRRTK